MNSDEVRTRLLTERARIQELRMAANRLTADAQEATERELSSAEQHPAELEAAVKRVDTGSYGNCEACGKPISEARLEAIPTARYCIDDQAKHDRNGRRNGR